jgi:hypothetical protein
MVSWRKRQTEDKLAINSEKALGLEVPAALATRAGGVIEETD